MIRISGVNIPENKHILIALTSIFGIGKSRSKKICLKFNINEKINIKQLNIKTIDSIREYISNFLVEGDLHRDIKLNIKRLIDINCYRGLRHSNKLPVRGQRTKTNARTSKGPRKIIRK
ncbi:30S ribosomal protein S13 [Enterobacteriaceae bacterium ET-AT1-13]|nr:30S ribosomal protein S13 [Enterobacteriaceae bacterium ET-AT1-13]WGS66349.1 30S ribosomal protein S13 [Enterobacteriaceae bacterium Cmel17]WMC17372.1 MAG: 30S ribosomal protein S13 [Enterobacteriaceae bacterium Cmel21]WMC17579.1 MAG: 30S ribosomal protein S13 [Enterobacteriaceae bacterium PSmelAO3-2]WMC17784.1 MAG: 30S ribosomal protein S13 [Enterobacteriaceae bacterium PSmelAO3-1]WMC17987.1 MAG: 30S ribosomal protein S13 [Enterobacteriaceae bacterium PSmelAO1]